MTIPHLRRNGSRMQLIVDDRPYLALGGELFNSTSSDPRHFGPVFAELAAAGVGTVIATVSWEQVETAEGSFDFTVLDELLAAARANSVRLVLIWFGAFKNAASTYAPRWVRADRRPVPPRGCPARAACQLHLRRCHAEAGAVGVLAGIAWPPTEQPIAPCSPTCGTTIRSTRWCSSRSKTKPVCSATAVTDRLLAELAWHSEVPPALVEAARSGRLPVSGDDAGHSTRTGSGGGTWSDVFVDDATTDEIFMAWALRLLRGRPRRCGQADPSATHLCQRLARAAAWSGAARPVPQRRPDRPDAKRLAARCSGHRRSVPGHLHR